MAYSDREYHFTISVTGDNFAEALRIPEPALWLEHVHMPEPADPTEKCAPASPCRAPTPTFAECVCTSPCILPFMLRYVRHVMLRCGCYNLMECSTLRVLKH